MKKIAVFEVGLGNGNKKLVKNEAALAVIRKIEEDLSTANLHSKEGCRKCWGKGFQEYSHHMGRMEKNGKMEAVVVLRHQLCRCVEKRICNMMKDL